MGSPHSVPKRKEAFFVGADNVLYCFGGLGVAGGYIEKGVTYLLIAFLLGLALWGLSRLKLQRPKRRRKKRKS